ncbi:MAG TPA: carbamoyltransferase [Bacteroidota bacterium]|nr:carbamoyltransferase [Bacteroidota bacterium]
MYILGISAYYHDSAACLLSDGDIVAAAQEERFTRKKHDHRFPRHAVAYCLQEAGISPDQLECVAFYDKPLLKFNRLLETYLTYAPRGIQSFIMAMPLWLQEKLWVPDLIEKEIDYRGKVIFPEHHESHAASAFFPSPYQRAAILTIDGVGEMATSSYGIGHDNRVEILSELHFPNSLGLLYSAFTYFTGFKVNSGEYKVMGLAPYGEPKYVDQIYNQLIDLKEDGSFRMNMEYFDFCAGLTMTNDKFDTLFGGKPRAPETPLTQRELDLARSIQDVTEEIMMRMTRHVKKVTEERYLCLAGGVALNCVANGKILRSGLFDDIWIQPAAGDAGGAIGAAYIAYHHFLDRPAKTKNGRDDQHGSYLGPAYDEKEVTGFLNEHDIPYELINSTETLCERAAQFLEEGKVIGWFQGRMEFGPRALGNRSIIGDARSPEMQKKMNVKIKFREGFRPFAPSVLAEKAGEWFDIDRESPYMLLVAEVAKSKQRKMDGGEKKLWGIDKLNVVRSEIPAVTHVDYSARLQTVSRDENPLYHKLISTFYKKTGVPVIVNTSFNVRGEPIVATPLDAYKCFMRTDLDILVIGNCILSKTGQPKFHDDIKWREVYELD